MTIRSAPYVPIMQPISSRIDINLCYLRASKITRRGLYIAPIAATGPRGPVAFAF